MSRFVERPYEWADIDKRFEGLAAHRHLRNAISYIQKLEEDGRTELETEPKQFERWRELCRELVQYLRKVGVDTERDLTTDMREFVHAFEHAQHRMYQISYGPAGFNDALTTRYVLNWLEFVFRHSTYAILSAHIPDKQAISTLQTHIYMDINLAEGTTKTTTTTTGEIIEPTVPRKYRGKDRRP